MANIKIYHIKPCATTKNAGSSSSFFLFGSLINRMIIKLKTRKLLVALTVNSTLIRHT